jgi:hypothetical protein
MCRQRERKRRKPFVAGLMRREFQYWSMGCTLRKLRSKRDEVSARTMPVRIEKHRGPWLVEQLSESPDTSLVTHRFREIRHRYMSCSAH